MSTRRPIFCSAALVFSAVLAAVGLLSSCSAYMAPNARDFNEVVKACEEAIKERYYQARVFHQGGHVVAYSQPELEGPYKIRHRIDVHIFYENTGHFMPKVFVRKYIDHAEPELEHGDFSSGYEVSGHPWGREDWKPIYYDRSQELEIRDAILAKLKITV
ncbi:MAG: hypothetical protein HY717_21010 [Planctomycetes bacterium]|nr:hypothetical protein [Planctomycetota bacterium]